jgi:hypothetical protein
VAEINRSRISGAHRVNTQVFGVKSHEMRGHEAVKWQEDLERPSEKERWRRSKYLANSGAHRVRAQVVNIQSHEDARREKENSCWIQIAGGPLDPHVGSCIETSREKTREFGCGGRKVARGEILIVGGQVAPHISGARKRKG